MSKQYKYWYEVQDINGASYEDSCGFWKFTDIDKAVLFAKKLRDKGVDANVVAYKLEVEVLDF